MSPPLTQSHQLAAVRAALGRGELELACEALFDAPLVSERALLLIFHQPQGAARCQALARARARATPRRPPFELALRDAASAGKLSKARALIQAGALMGNPITSALCQAVACPAPSKIPAMVALLLAQGVDPNQRDLRGRLALLKACARPQPSNPVAVQTLLAAGADPWALARPPSRFTQRLSCSPRGHDLHISSASAAALANPSLMPLLISNASPAQLSGRDSLGRSALHWAAEAAAREAGPLLARRGANPFELDHQGQSALALAAASGSGGPELSAAIHAAYEAWQLEALSGQRPAAGHRGSDSRL